MIYLDFAAATPVDKFVLSQMLPYFEHNFYNPSADYAEARAVRQALSEAREKIAFWLGSKSNEIIFTAGGTEANNLAIRGVMDNHPGANLLISSIEHDSIIEPSKQYDHRIMPVLPDGRIDPNILAAAINDNTVLVSVMYANNEIGVIQPIRKLAQVISTIRQDRKARGITMPIYFHSDGCQAGNYLDLHVSRLEIDMMSINGGKIYGPKQSGALFIKKNVALMPLIYGGGQELNLRSGTENVAADIGLAVALDKAQSIKTQEAKRLSLIRDYFIEQLEQLIPNSVINGSREYRLANNVHVSLPGQDNEYLLIALDQLGIKAAAGSACSAAKEESSHVLRALGLSDAEARTSLRFSMGRTTKKTDIDAVIRSMLAIMNDSDKSHFN